MQVLDTDRDGRISKEELSAAAEKFAELDSNDDGQLDPHELFGPPPGERGPRGEARKGRKRRVAESGKKPEGAKKRRKPRKGNAGAKLFKKLDKDGDGAISRDEAPKKLKRRFDKLDTNSDGEIDQAEFKKAAQQRGKKKQRKQKKSKQTESS